MMQPSNYPPPNLPGESAMTPAPTYVAPAPTSVWRVAAAVFVGNVICFLLTLVITFCFFGGLGLLGGGRR